MILSDREIRAALERGAIKVTPVPAAEAWSSTAIDLRLAKDLVEWTRPGGAGMETVVCPASSDYDFAIVRDKCCKSVVIPTGGYVFKSHAFILGWTEEKIQLPHRSRLAVRVEGKSSLARLGIGVHVTAPTIHAGFGFKKDDADFAGSPLQLEMWNAGPADIKLIEGMPICQLIFEIVDGTPEKGYEGRFNVQGPTVNA